MVVILILWVLFTALYLGSQPYMMRSRDTKRVTDMLSYTNILDTYDKNFDTFPSNKGSGNVSSIPWYCLSEIVTRSDVSLLGNEGKFTALHSETSHPPIDPIKQIAYAPTCPEAGSYIYSRLDYGQWWSSQLALIAARLEVIASANYATGSDLTNSGSVQSMLNARKWDATNAGSDRLYIVYKLH